MQLYQVFMKCWKSEDYTSFCQKLWFYWYQPLFKSLLSYHFAWEYNICNNKPNHARPHIWQTSQISCLQEETQTSGSQLSPHTRHYSHYYLSYICRENNGGQWDKTCTETRTEGSFNYSIQSLMETNVNIKQG